MIKKSFLVTLLLIGFVLSVEAETVLLKNGTVIDSEIIEKNKERIKIEVNGVPITYYADSIRSIDGLEPLEFLGLNDMSDNQPTSEDVLENIDDDQTLPIRSKTELILEFIDVFGTRESLTRNFEELIRTAPPKQSEKMKQALNVDELIQQLVPLYDKNFTEDDLQAYILFYSSVEGKKLIKTTPLLMEQSVGVSLKYLKEHLPDIPSKEIQ